MTRPGKPNGFYYLSHQTTDSDCGIITAVTVTPEDVHGSRLYLEQLAYVHKNVVPLQAAAADSAYDLPLAHRVLEELGIDFFVVPQPAYDRTKAELKRAAFAYDRQQLSVSQWKATASKAAVAQRQRTVLGILDGQKGLRDMPAAGQMSE